MISRRNLRLLIALMLPLMVLRGLLPTGYMAAAEGGKLRIVMCSAGLVAGDKSPDTGTGDHTVTDPGHCLFAHAATLAPPAQAVLTVATTVLHYWSSADFRTLPPATGPPRTAAARAPPAFLA